MTRFSMRKSKKAEVISTSWVQRVPSSYVGDAKPYYFNLSESAVGDDKLRFEKPDGLKSEEERAKTSGEWVWVPHPSDVWQVAKVLKRASDGSVQVQPYKGSSFTVPASGVMGPCRETGTRVQEVPLWAVNFTALGFLEDDVIQCDPVNQAMVVHNTRERYAKDSIYSWVGANRAVLLAVNPYQDLPALFDEDTQRFHKSQDDKPDKWIPPHVFAIANEAYDSMVAHDADQSVLVSGESGSGKTESTKHVLEFFAKQVGSDEVEHHVAQKLLAANPLLEAFGNAVTIRNNNSSRFGKWIAVTFSRATQKITGATFTNFMLEKTRVVHHQEKERSFHVFYGLLQDTDVAGRLGLGKPADYAYLNQSSASVAAHGDDAARQAAVKVALQELEFPQDEQAGIFEVIGGVLSLGNVAFKDQAQSSGVTGSEPLPGAWLGKAAELLGVDEPSLAEVLTTRTVAAGGDSSAVALDAVAAKDAADALAKAVYGRLFNFLVKRVNESMAPPGESYFIGVLDIFGFEILETNSFEQLCINYANEKLQQYFNAHTFDAEERLYKAEGVDYAFLKFIDNQPVLDMLEAKPSGMLLLLDDEGALPGGSDKGWLGKVEKLFSADKNFETDFRRKFESTLSFEVRHYADVVKYDAVGFVKKNKDTLWDDLYQLMSASANAVLKQVFPAREMRSSNTKPVAAQFRGHVNALLKLIKATEVRFVRCIKPNEAMAPAQFDTPLVVQQLRYSGVFETIEIRQGGFPFRLTHKQFAFRFACINLGHTYAAAQGAADSSSVKWRNLSAEILNTYAQTDLSQDVQIGANLVLYRVGVHKPLSLARNLAIEVVLPKHLQNFVRGALGRHYANQLSEAQGTLAQALAAGNDIALLRKGFAQAASTKEWLAPNLAFLPAYPMHLHVKGEHLEGRLVAWEELEAELEASSAGKQAADVDVHLYKQLIALCLRADTDLSDVVRTKAQQELYEHCQGLIADSPPGQMDAAAGPALASLDRARMQSIKDQSDDIGYQTETVEKIAHVLSRLLHLDAEFPAALEVLDSVRMKEALDEAQQYKYSSAETAEVERLFDMPEETFVKMELEVAIKVGDKPREIHRRIRLKEIAMDKPEAVALYSQTWESGHSREPTQFAKGAGMCGRTAIVLGMRKWSPKALPNPLSLVPGETGAGDKDDKDVKKLKKLCKAQFLNLQRFMGDKKAANPEKFAQKLIDFGVQNPKLRNELYLQLIKQLTENPEPESVAKGYELMGLATAAFLPSDGFEFFMVRWLMDHPPADGNWRAYTSGIHKLQFQEEDDNVEAPANKSVKSLRSDFEKLRDEGSRFSIAIDAFTGPTEAQRQAELDKIMKSKKAKTADDPAEAA